MIRSTVKSKKKIDPDRPVLPGSYTNAKKVKIVCQANNMNFRRYNMMDNIGIPLEQWQKMAKAARKSKNGFCISLALHYLCALKNRNKAV